MLAGAGSKVDQVVGNANRLFVVLDDDDRVAEVAKVMQRSEQRAVVALMQSDRRLVEHVQHAGQVRANLRGQPDALPLPSRQRRRAAAQRQIADADVVEESEPILNFLEHTAGDEGLALAQIEAVEHVVGFADGQVHVLGNRAALHLHREALRLQPLAMARRARPQRTIHVEVFLLGPRRLVEPAAQVGDDAFEAFAVAAVKNLIADLLRQVDERRGRVEPEVFREAGDRFAHELPVALRPRNDRAVGERLGLVGHDAIRIEIVHRPEPLALGARAVRRVEGKRARRHLGHADAALDAGQLAREQPIASFERVDDDDIVGKIQGDLDGFGQPALDARLHDQAIDDDVDGVVAAPVELDVFVERAEHAVDARLGEPFLLQLRELFLELPLAAADDGRQHVDARVLRIQHHHVHDALERLRGDFAAALMAVRDADVGEQQPQVVVDFGDGADRRARIRRGRLLLDGDRGREAVDQIDVGLLHLLEKLPRVGRQRLDVAPLPFGVDRVEGKRRLARAGQPGDDRQLVPRNIDVDIAKVMNARAAYGYPALTHLCAFSEGPETQ